MMGIIAVIGLSFVYRDYYQRKTQTQYRHRLLEQLKAHQLTLEEILSRDYVPGDIICYLRQEKHILIQHPV